MSIPQVSASGVLSSYSSSYQMQHDEIDDLIIKFNSGTIPLSDFSQEAEKLIKEIKELDDISLARKRLCKLCMLPDAEVQEKVAKVLRSYLKLDLLHFDIRENQTVQLIELEEQISEAISIVARSDSYKSLVPLLEIYVSVLERLWLLLYLTETSNRVIISNKASVIKDRVQRWMAVLDRAKDNNIKDLTQSIGAMLKKVEDGSHQAAQMIHTLKPYLNHLMFSAMVGEIYQRLGDVRGAIRCYIENLNKLYSLAGETEEKERELDEERYNLLRLIGRGYQTLGEYSNAIGTHNQALAIAERLGDLKGMTDTFNSLGIAYHSLGKYLKAHDAFNKSLSALKDSDDEEGKCFAYHSLGIVYETLGESQRAIDTFKMAEKIAESFNDKTPLGVIYGSLGISYDSIEEYSRAIESYKRALELLQDDPLEIARINGNLGNSYRAFKEYDKAIDCHTKQHEIAEGIRDGKSELGRAYGGLGLVYYYLEEVPENSITNYKISLQIARELNETQYIADRSLNLGLIYERSKNLAEAEQCFREAIKYFSIFQHELKDEHQWKITQFELQAKAFIGLERVLLKQSKIHEALEVSDARRSRVLVELLVKKLYPQEKQPLPLTLMGVEEMKSLALRLKTTFIVYTFTTSETGEKELGAWIIPGSEPIIWESLSTALLSDEMLDENRIFQSFPYKDSGRPKKGVSPTLDFKTQLSKWSQVLIQPIEMHMPKDGQKTLTIVTEDFLSQVPFSALQYSEGKYLIEKYPISIAPSINVLRLLTQFKKDIPETSLIIGNPTTPKKEYNDLLRSEDEVNRSVKPYFSKSVVLTQNAPSPERVINEMGKARFIHLACHGVAVEKRDQYSVFEGFFRLASDDQKIEGHLYAQEIASLSIRSELVFMSACHSGRGKIQKEGSIGPVWSFLVAGASSTIATYWPLPESELTLKMVETFYRYIFGWGVEKLNKAQALQKAMLLAIDQNRDDIRQWGAFFFAGLDTKLNDWTLD